MNENKIILSSKITDISDTNDAYLTLTNMVCYYDDTNLNNVLLPYTGCEEDATNYAQTLVNMPVQAKYKKIRGKDDLGSHEKKINSKGEVSFSTESIGVNTKVWIENADIDVKGETKNLPVLYATYRVWKRYTNVINAIKRLYDEGKLTSSWEIATKEYSYKNGVKTLTDYYFLANTLLGSNSTASYTNAKAISLSSIEENDDEMLIAEALSLDISEKNNKEDNTLEGQTKTSNTTQVNPDVSENTSKDNTQTTTTVEDSVNKNITTDTQNTDNTSDSSCGSGSGSNTTKTNDKKEKKVTTKNENKKEKKVTAKNENKNDKYTEIASLTNYDLQKKLSVACKEKLKKTNPNFYYGYISYFFPLESTVWFRDCDAESDLDFYKFTYSVDENETVTVSEPIAVKLTVTVAEINSTIEKLNSEIENKNVDLSTKNDAILKLNDTIKHKDNEISELNTYKEKFELAEQEKIEAEKQEQRKQLKEYAIASTYITEDEIETSEELKGFINNLDKTSIKNIIADRVVANVTNINNSSKNIESEKSNDKKEQNNIEVANLNNGNVELDKVSIMRNFLKRK